MKKSPKVLVIRLSAYGDIVLTTPVVRCLKKQLGAEIHYLVKERYAAAIAGNPYVHQVHLMADDQSVASRAAELQKVDFDLVVDLHHNLRSWVLKRRLAAPATSFPKLNIEKWLMVNFKIDRLPDVHIVDRYFETVRKLGVGYDGEGLDFMVAPEVLATARERLGRLGLDDYLCLAIGAGLPTKCFETGQLIQLIGLLETRVVLLGGPGDKETGRKLEEQFAHVTNLAGEISLIESAAVIESAMLLITPDTGLMHIAAALDTSMIAYWGNTIPEFGMTPFYREDSTARLRMFEKTGLSCRPCSKIGYAKCPKGHFRCIRQLDINAMAKTANTWIGQPRDRTG